MIKDLPYNECYACITTTSVYDTFTIHTEIRNPEGGEFRGDFELTSRFYISSGFDHAYGGELCASAFNFSLRTLESAAKVLRKAYKKSDTMNKKYGYTSSATETIIRQLQASGAKEVRIATHDERFPGWNNVDVWSVKSDLETIRIKLQKLERIGEERFPFTGKI
jgi:hypothetical protein